MNINLNERYYDFIRLEQDIKKQWELIKDELENMDIENIIFNGDDIMVSEIRTENLRDEFLSASYGDIDTIINDYFNEENQEYFYMEELEENLSTLDYPLNYKGKYKTSSYLGNKVQDMNIIFNDSQELYEFLTQERARGTFAILDNNELHIPMEDLGGGIITHTTLKLVENTKGANNE